MTKEIQSSGDTMDTVGYIVIFKLSTITPHIFYKAGYWTLPMVSNAGLSK